MMPATSPAKSPRAAGFKVLSLSTIGLLLLAGCGAKEELPPLPASPSASASASSAGATAAASGSGSESASPEASATETQRYSGGSKAPEGEYRAADEHGPAQNVPKPVKPEGMNVESEEGLYKFLTYWNDAVNYGIETGDFTVASSLIGPEYKVDEEFYAWAHEIYSRGGWIVGGRRAVTVGEGLLVSYGDGKYTWAGNLNTESIQPFLDGPGARNAGSVGEGIYFIVNFSDGKWRIDNVKPIEG